MCLAYPGKIVSIDGENGEVDFGGFTKKVNLMLMSESKIGDFVLVHAGFAIGTTTEGDAIDTLDALHKVDNALNIGNPK
ncbi:HypC/HybG/HupF family hydrogenase formation chaperone [bacterium]|nr:HypC/HybG/HupF family hydrogenase formation chaperone [bacterium]